MCRSRGEKEAGDRRGGRLVLVALLALVAAACGRQAVVQSGPAATERVDVRLEDYTIRMPMAVTEGEIVFLVRNEGEERHGFELRGNDVHRSLTEELRPGETASLRVRLAPGSYEVYCPLADHAAIGMSRRITVTRGG